VPYRSGHLRCSVEFLPHMATCWKMPRCR